MEFMAKGDKKLKAFSLFGNKKEEALELYQKGAVSAPSAADHYRHHHHHCRPGRPRPRHNDQE